MKTLTELKKELLKDEEFKKAYHALDSEYELIELMIRKRLKEGLTQSELAEKIGTKQSAISRFERGDYNPTVSFLHKVADALGVNLKISIVKPS